MYHFSLHEDYDTLLHNSSILQIKDIMRNHQSGSEKLKTLLYCYNI